MDTKVKCSGIEWIGEIPKDWKTVKVKDLFNRKNTKANQKDPTILSLARDGIKIRDISNNEGQLASDYTNYNPVSVNDILLNPMDLISGDNCNISRVEGVISPAYINLRHKKDVNPEFYNFFFKYLYWSKVFFVHGKGVSYENRWTLNYETLSQMKIPYPPYEDQNKISNYLTKKLSMLDNIKTDIITEIRSLEKYKQSIITETVTKGLDQTVEMKDSGIEWIGKVPKHWKLGKLKYFLLRDLQYGASESGVVYREDLPRYIRITDIDENNKLKENNKLSLTEDQAKGYILDTDAVLFARSGATVGKTFLYKKEYGYAAFAGYLIAARCNERKMLNEWLYYYTLSNSYKTWIEQSFTQSTIQNINAERYSNLSLTIPEIDIQKEIIHYLDEECSKINQVIQDKQQQLELLNEYKKSLIYEYVTGKKAVAEDEI